MKIIIKILKWFFISLLSILLLGFLYIYFVFLAKPGEISSISEIDDHDWHTIPMGGETTCSNESEFFIFTRSGNSENLIIHFSGGGACWDDITCFTPLTLMSIFLNRDSRDLKAFYFADIFEFFPVFFSGIFNGQLESNPFKDWNIVFIPYCTGDLHVGNVTNTYNFKNESFQIHHRGRSNTLAALQWIASNYENPKKILVSGESAGAYASAFWTPFITTIFDNEKIYQLSDGALLASNRWSEIMDTVWNAESLSFLNFEINKDVFEDALLNRRDSIGKRIKYLHSNTIYDLILPKFSSALNHISSANDDYINNWSQDMLVSMKKLADSDLDYHYFISNYQYDSVKHATQHTLVANEGFNSCESDQITFAKWLQKTVIDDESISVGSQFLDLPNE